MPRRLDLDVFVTRLWQLKLSLTWVAKALEGLEETSEYRKSFDFHLPPPGSGLTEPDLEVVELLKQASQVIATDQSAMHREVIGRATLIYGWAVLENLLEDCVHSVFERNPVALLEHSSDKGRMDAIRCVLVDDWQRRQVVRHMLDLELQKFRRTPFADWPRYFEKRLDVSWPTEAFSALEPIAQRRNEAAHARQFEDRSFSELAGDIKVIYDQGAAIATAVSAKTGVELADNVFRTTGSLKWTNPEEAS